MKNDPSPPIYRHISRLRWLVLVVGFTLTLVHELLEGYVRWQGVLPWDLIELIYGVIVTLSIWFILTRLGVSIQETGASRSRELTMLSRVQGIRKQAHLQDELAGVLADTVTALEADGGVLLMADRETAVTQIQAEVGRPLGNGLALVKGLAAGAKEADSPIIIQELEAAVEMEARSLLIAPMQIREKKLGSLVLWSAVPGLFDKRQAQLVATVAGQAALLIENQRLSIYGEYQATLAERARLSREIHDGLAQTISYLKLQVSQITDWMENGEVEQAVTGLTQVRQRLTESYIVTRKAIDGLRLNAKANDLPTWVKEIATAFEATSNIPVVVTLPPEIKLAPEMQIQIRRIVQEALNNIHKHADATRAWLVGQLDDGWLTLKISDNGHGFDLDHLSRNARHGISIMRERAELLGADFRISSQTDNGTQIIVRLPLKNRQGEVSVG